VHTSVPLSEFYSVTVYLLGKNVVVMYCSR